MQLNMLSINVLLFVEINDSRLRFGLNIFIESIQKVLINKDISILILICLVFF